MFAVPRVFRRFLRYIRDRNIPMPLDDQPLEFEDWDNWELDDAMDRWKQSRLDRYGPSQSWKIELTGVWRITDYIGESASNLFIKPTQALSFEAIVELPGRKPIEVVGMLPSGTQWTAELEETYLAHAVRRAVPNIENLYETLRNHRRVVSWFVNSWEPIGGIRG